MASAISPSPGHKRTAISVTAPRQFAPALLYYLPSMAVCVTLPSYIHAGRRLLAQYDHHGW